MATGLKELLELKGNRLEGEVLHIRDTGVNDIVKIVDPKIKKIMVYTSAIYIVMSGDKKENNISVIQLEAPHVELAIKNITADCLIAMKGTAELRRMTRGDNEKIPASINLGVGKN